MMKMKKSILILLCIAFICKNNCFNCEPCKPKIAIIGAGIGGASASYFLQQLFEENVEIDIFESKSIGGRIANVELGGEEFDAGGTIIHTRNQYMQYFINLLKLDKRPILEKNFSIWNGKELIIQDINSRREQRRRYNLEPFYLHGHVHEVLDDFDNIYKIQDEGIAFDNVNTLLDSMNKNFTKLRDTSIKEYLIHRGYGEQLIDEIVKSVLVVNYGQSTDVHAFVGLISLAGAESDLWAVKGGNKKIPEGLILKNKKASFIHATVTMVKRKILQGVPKYEVHYEQDDEDKVYSGTYDIVILAAPIIKDQENPIIFKGFENPNFEYLGDYQTSFETFVKGDINFSYFGLEKENEGIMSCKPHHTKISFIGKVSSVEGVKSNSTSVWKIYSRNRLDEPILRKMFLHVSEIKEIRWKAANPQYISPNKIDTFKLDNSFYYISAIEWIVGALEMSAIGGRNVAILAFKDYKKCCSTTYFRTRPLKNKDCYA